MSPPKLAGNAPILDVLQPSVEVLFRNARLDLDFTISDSLYRVVSTFSTVSCGNVLQQYQHRQELFA